MIFPLVQPVLKISFLVTMWDTPDSDGGGVGGVLSSVGTAVLNAAAAFLAGGFSTVEGLETLNQLETYQEGGDNQNELRFFSRATYAKIAMKRGVTFNTDIWDWQNQVVLKGRKSRKSGSIVLMDTKQLFDVGVGAAPPFQHFPVAAWTFHNALPTRLTGPGLDARDGSGPAAVAIETLELHAERVERMSLSLVPGIADLNSALTGLIGAGAGAAAGLGAAGLSAL
ncbi:phage tail-like protein [Bradyrhizobium sp. AZCC 2262]|uniref:phage tail protein n=1 Tax=Bradyrhizobium sp. AZCC 2262 TaxID=3117022 RepID=UPI002FF0A36B